MNKTANFPLLLQTFFTDRLIRQRNASPHTITSYRDTFRLLLDYAQQQKKRIPSNLKLDDLDAPFIVGFLTHLEKERGNSPRSRNARLSAIHSFFQYLAFEQPEYSDLIQRVLAIPSKRYDRTLVDFLTRPEVEVLLSIPDRGTWSGRRDHALIAFAIQTGLRVSELTGLCCQDITLSGGPHVRCYGKGRKERCTPLTKQIVSTLRAWLSENNGDPKDPLFPNAQGKRLTSDGVSYILSKHVKIAREQCPSLKKKRVTPHVLRHTTAMNLLQSGVDTMVIALWLGHESVETTKVYIDLNTEMKEEVLKKVPSSKTYLGRYRPDDKLLVFLNNL